MPRLTTIDDVLFPVELHPVVAQIRKPNGVKRVPIPGKRAVMNMRNRTVVGVVSSGYRLFTNGQALRAAKQCCQTVFPETRLTEWDVSAVEASSSASYCHIDLVHRTSNLDFQFLYDGVRPEVPEAFGPFVRVTNSYNGRRALTFNIGFHRKMCLNGLVGPDVIVRFRFDHTQADLGTNIEFNVDRQQVSKLKESFLDSFKTLRQCSIDAQYFTPLIQSIICLKAPRNSPEHPLPAWQSRDWYALEQRVDDLSQKYLRDLGGNAYAVLNAVTELASHPPSSHFIRRDRNSLQRLAGEWMLDFRKLCTQPGFSVADYLYKLTGESAPHVGRAESRAVWAR